MACLSSTRRTQVQAQITRWEALLEKAYDFLNDSNHIGEYRFDSEEGSQKTVYRTLKELMDFIDKCESMLDYLRNKLNGTGIVNMNMRRKQY